MDEAEYLLVSSLRSLLVVPAFGLLRYLVYRGLEGGMHIASSRSPALLRSDTAIVVQRLALLADPLIGIVMLASLLASWGLYDNPMEALNGLLAIGFSVEGKRVNVGHIVAAVMVLFGAFLVSGLLQRLLVQGALTSRQMETGVQLAIARLVHYALVFVGFVVALATLGFEFTQLTILLSALGVGIGFGLQAMTDVVNLGGDLLFIRQCEGHGPLLLGVLTTVRNGHYLRLCLAGTVDENKERQKKRRKNHVLAYEDRSAPPGQQASRSALAACKSGVSKPSVNQWYTGASSSLPSACLPCCCHSRLRLSAARSSNAFAC